MLSTQTKAGPRLLTDPAEIAVFETTLNRHGASGAEIADRYNQAVKYTVPWVSRVAPLDDAIVLEMGCGSGSSAAAFAPRVRHVFGYDIQPYVIDATKARARLLGLDNITPRVNPPGNPTEYLMARHPGGVDIVLLYAVIEHCTPQERIGMLRTTWQLLRPGGHLVVVETPNRLAYNDFHTTVLPFFHFLPPTLALRTYRDSPRSEIVELVSDAHRNGDDAAMMALCRAGVGASYHEFVLGLDESDLSKILVADGFEAEMLAHFPLALEDKLLSTFFLEFNVPAPLGFSRAVLNLIFRKPDGTEADNHRIDPKTRQHLVTNFARNDTEEHRRQAELYRAFGDARRIRLLMTPDSKFEAVNLLSIKQFGDKLIMQNESADPQLLLPPLSYGEADRSIALIDISAPQHTMLQLFYSVGGAPFSEESSSRYFINAGRNVVLIELPAKTAGQLRLDPGTNPGQYELHLFEVREP